MKIKTKLFKLGNSYAMLVPKALVDCEILHKGKTYEIEIKEKNDKENLNNL